LQNLSFGLIESDEYQDFNDIITRGFTYLRNKLFYFKYRLFAITIIGKSQGIEKEKIKDGENYSLASVKKQFDLPALK
jgi:hypothetical protein